MSDTDEEDDGDPDIVLPTDTNIGHLKNSHCEITKPLKVTSK